MRVLLAGPHRIALELPFPHEHSITRCATDDLETFGRLIAEADAVVVPFGRIRQEVIERAGPLRLIQKLGAGTDTVDVATATARGIPVAATPGQNAGSVAELAIMFMLYLGRAVEHQRRRLQGGQWHDVAATVAAVELNGATLGIVGLGAIGVELARLARVFGLHLLAYSRAPRPELEQDLGVERVPLAELLGRSDFVVLAVPLTDETRGLIDAAALARMRPGAFLINVARGPVVDETALIEALRANRIAGAGLDVFAAEPLDSTSPLLQLPNVLATPHIGGITGAGWRRMWNVVAENLARVERGEPPIGLVNPEVLASTVRSSAT